ncbi:MAG: DNA integrity scanning diadenylate cyclase DisA [Actinomycetota bacterium]
MDIYRNERLAAILRRVAPGTPLRQSCDRIIASKHGALIVLSNRPDVMALLQGGFEINADFLSSKLYELAKMDGAIIISSDYSRILRANVHLAPDMSIISKETGTRSRTAERVARQTGAPVLCVSEEMGQIFLFLDDIKYTLEDIRILMSRGTQALQALEKYRLRLNQVLNQLTNLEFEGLAALEDVLVAVQRLEMVERISEEISGYVIELGVDGRLIELQLDELVSGIKVDFDNLLKDYCRLKKGCSVTDTQKRLGDLDDEELLDYSTIARILGYAGSKEAMSQYVTPKGYRMLSRIPRLSTSVINRLVEKFGNLNNIIRAGRRQLEAVEGVGVTRARVLQDGLRRMSETNMT